MEPRRTVLWVIFSLSLLLLWDAWLKHTGHPTLLSQFLPSQSGPAAPATTTVRAPNAAPSDVPTAPPAGTSGVPTGVGANAPAAGGAATPSPSPTNVPHERVTVRTDILTADIDTIGAELARLELLRQRDATDSSRNMVLLDDRPDEHIYLAQSGVIGGAFPNHRTAFAHVPGETALAAGQDRIEVAFEAEGGDDNARVKVRKTYTFKRGSYEIDVRHEIVNTGQGPVSPSLYLQILRDGKAPKEESRFNSSFTGPAVYSDETKFKKISFSDVAKKKAALPPPAKDGWIAMLQHYFVTAWVPAAGVERRFEARELAANDPYPVETYAISTIEPVGTLAPGARHVAEAKLFAGPQIQSALEKTAPGLDLVVDYGWLTVVAKPLFWLLELLHRWVDNWGFAIVLLTIVVKGAFYPLSAASYKSMAKMRAVAPRLTKIREQYENDRQKMNLAMMELYKTEKINPLGGCLPIVVQMPVFIALYWVLNATVEMRGAPWIGWIRDLTAPDPFYVLPVIMIGTMWVQYKLNPTPPDPVQAKVFAIMPFVFGATMIFFPAGLVLYWVVNNCLSIAQQWQITRMIEGKPLFGRAKA